MRASMSPNMGRIAVPEQRPDERRGEGGAGVRTLDQKIEALHIAFRDALLRVGDYRWLAAAIGENPDTYQHDIAKGVARRADREAQLRWLVPLLDDPKSAEEFLGQLCQLAGFMPPTRRLQVSQAEFDAAVAEVIAEQGGALEQMVRDEVARKLRVRHEDLP